MLSIFVGAAALLYDRDPDARRQFSHRRWKIDVLIFHNEPENASADAAAETMKRLTLRAHVKRGRFLLMERAERLEIGARAFERKVGTNHFDNIISRGDLLDCFWWNHVRRLFFARLLNEAMPNLSEQRYFPNNEEIVDLPGDRAGDVSDEPRAGSHPQGRRGGRTPSWRDFAFSFDVFAAR